MQRGGGGARTSAGRAGSTRGAPVAALALALFAAGCMPDQLTQATTAMTTTPMRAAPTVSFESIDGPPPLVFNRLVENLSTEALARRIAVVSREGQASYRIRGYLAAHVERGQVHIGWVWDVYDVDKRRSLRIAGEEPGAGGRRADAWQAADEQMIRRIARASMDRLVAFLGSAEGPPGPVPAAQGGPVVAAAPAAAAPTATAALALPQ